VAHDEVGVLFDVGSLYERCLQLMDGRKARGKVYPLALVVMAFVLAKLAGEDKPTGIAEWVRHRSALLVECFRLKHARMPHADTYRRLLGRVVDVAELDGLVNEFLGSLPSADWSVQVCLDGKTFRGTIPHGASQGLHLLAAYVPGTGVVLCQVAVDGKSNEIGAAPQLLKALDLKGKIVTADALLTQRALVREIVEADGDYALPVKENQPHTLAAIEKLFEAQVASPGHGTPPNDFRVAQQVSKGHGRIETRTLTASSLLAEYLRDELDWSGAAQVYQLERTAIETVSGTTSREVVFGLTSLTAQAASPARLLSIVRAQWAIESQLHWRRDVLMHEDQTRVTRRAFAQVLSILNNLVLALVLQAGWSNLAQARRRYAAHPDEGLPLLLKTPGGSSPAS
jgi:predicted transposase YbfD/YdcC